MNDCDVASVRMTDIIRFYDLHGIYELDQNTTSHRGVKLKGFFRFALDEGERLLFNPERIPIPPREFRMPDPATDEEFIALMNAIPKTKKPVHVRNRAVLLMMRRGGLRVGEAVSLKSETIDTVKKQGIVQTEKKRSGTPFDVFSWDDLTNDAIIEWLKIRNAIPKDRIKSDNLFLSLAGKTYGQAMVDNTIRVAMLLYCRKAGIRDLHPHCLRHAFALEFSMGGASGIELKAMTRHKNVSSTDPYTFFHGEHKRQTYDKFIVDKGPLDPLAALR